MEDGITIAAMIKKIKVLMYSLMVILISNLINSKQTVYRMQVCKLLNKINHDLKIFTIQILF